MANLFFLAVYGDQNKTKERKHHICSWFKDTKPQINAHSRLLVKRNLFPNRRALKPFIRCENPDWCCFNH